jgi:uncharacterized phiE125 gp8 family phage protein
MSVNYPASSRRVAAPHAVAVLVTPLVPLVSSSVAVPTVLETSTPHGLVSGDTVAIASHTGSTPALDGAHVVTVIDTLHVSVPVAVTGAGAGGTLTRTIAAEPLTLTQGKLWAGFEWVDGDPREALMQGFIAMARSQVQRDTGVVPLLATYDVFFDALSVVIELPWRPVPSVTSLEWIDRAGARHTLDASDYTLDPGSEAPLAARVALSMTAEWPTDLRPFQPWVMRIMAGWPSVARIPPWFVHAMGLLTAHYATLGRDLASLDPAELVPYGYEDAIASYRLVVVA